MKKINLSTIKVQVHEKVTNEFLNGMKFEAGLEADDFIFNQMTYKLWKEIVCEVRTQEKTILYVRPLTFWQHVKEKCLPKFILKWSPVIYYQKEIKVVFEERFLYPSLEVESYKKNTFRTEFTAYNTKTPRNEKPKINITPG